jgi:SAM-dependent methyltransferase
MGEAGLIPTTDQFGTALGDIFRCRTCGHMQLVPMPTPEMLDAAYADAASDDYVDEEAGQRATARSTLNTIERQSRAVPGRLLDLGCWVGFLLSEAKQRGWETLGVEPSEFGHRYATETLGLEVIRSGLFEAELPAASYDAVTLGDVIEHLPEPGAALDRIHGLLADGGVLWMALPDAGSALARVLGPRWWSVIPTHVQYFTRASVARLLERHGFEVLELGSSPKSFTVAYYLGRIGGYSPALGRGLVAMAKSTRAADRMWAPDFRDRMYVIARKK